jgi:hypothetical protein
VKVDVDLYHSSARFYEQDPTSRQAILNTQQNNGLYSACIQPKPSLSREETLKLYLDLENEKSDILVDAIKSGRMDELKKEGNDDAMTSFMKFYPSARAHDKLFLEKQISEQQFSDASTYYKLQLDPAVISATQKNFLRNHRALKDALGKPVMSTASTATGDSLSPARVSP